VFIKYIRVIVFRVPVKCETKHNEIYQNETKLHHVYLWYTLRDFQNGPMQCSPNCKFHTPNSPFVPPTVIRSKYIAVMWMHSVIILILHGSYTKSLELWNSVRLAGYDPSFMRTPRDVGVETQSGLSGSWGSTPPSWASIGKWRLSPGIIMPRAYCKKVLCMYLM
jgi:hypothetical protein